MTTDQMLDHILIPRPNGSEGLELVADFIARTLEHSGADVTFNEFLATPHGFQLAWTAALLLAVLGLWRRRYQRERPDLPRLVTIPVAVLAMLPFAAMFWFQTVGPLVRTPSPGAIDNGGSVAALLHCCVSRNASTRGLRMRLRP